MNCKLKQTSEAQVIQIANSYLASSPHQKAELEKVLYQYNGPIETVIQELVASQEKQWRTKTGEIMVQRFTAPELREKYTDDLLYFFVPEAYDPTKPFGLLIMMHGGDESTPRENAQHVITSEKDKYSYDLQTYIEHIPFITVAPSAPWDEKNSRRWNVPEADDYIAAVIRESQYRFNIDRDWVFLGGISMGGYGAYHLCQRLSDKLAGGILWAGRWEVTNWRCMIGTPLFIIHGTNDAAAPGTVGKSARPRWTDVFYARVADKLLAEAGVEHVYAEYEGVHYSPRELIWSVSKLVKWMNTKRRDAFFPHVVAVTPRGWDARYDLPTPHSRWVSILEIGDKKMEFDMVERTGPYPAWGETLENFNKQGFRLTKMMVKAGLADAEYRGKNVFKVKTKNVRKFSLWLHPKMVDFAKPVVVITNGKKQLYEVKPTLLDVLRSYERRKDWDLIYYCELVVETIGPN